MKYLSLLAGCFIFLAVSSVQSIAQQSTIGTGSADAAVTQPIKVTALTLNAGRSRSGNAARWLTEPLIQVENTSKNVIEYVVIEISVPGTGSVTNGPLMLAYGQTRGSRPSRTVMEALAPGKKVSLNISRNACEAVYSQLLSTGVRPLLGSRASTRINAVVFTNGTAWFDGIMHVADPDDPSRWNVMTKNSDVSRNTSLLKFMQAGFRVNFNPVRLDQCWKRIGTQWVDCCGLRAASAIMVQEFGGLFEPFVMNFDCGDGTYCEYIKQVECSSDPGGGGY